MLLQRHRLRQQLGGLQQRERQGKPNDQGMSRLWEQIQRSQMQAAQRKQALPVPQFPSELPISEKRDEIAELIAKHQVIILCGETGSGKSTQLPKICLGLGRGVFGRIGHTQPRRIAARALATRISSELGRELGECVGYKVRFHDRVGPASHIKLMTDGMLLAEVHQDPFLNEYDTLIIDEAHERSLNIDFLLGYLKGLLPKRPDLKLIITSATIDPERFAEHFRGAPIINVSGRTYLVEVCYQPPEEEGGSERDNSMQQAIVDAVDQLSCIDRGDILLFLSGEREIRETVENLRKHKLPLTELLPLYARLGPAEQGRIFKPGGSRRIILATNVAETSLTVPGIRYVIDAGYARISRYSHRSKVQRLPVERISQASANQRKGRCGRVAAGVCIRLYSEEDFDSRSEFTEPEIQRTNLASVILQMKFLGFGDIEAFPFLDPPDSRLIKDGYRVLEEIGAVDKTRQVTRIGRQLARLPVDPRVGRMLYTAAHTHCLNEILVIAAALSIQDPRDRPMDKRQAADEAHRQFRNEDSDFLGFLNLWKHLEEQRRHLTRRKFQAHCRTNFLSWTRVQEWHDTHHQLRGQMHELGYKENQAEAGYEEIHKALLTGLLSNIGLKDSGKGNEFLGGRNSRFLVFPGSGLFQKPPKWVVAAELVETTKLYARTVASIRPEWVESVSGHLVKRSYSEPHWEKRRGQVAAYERVTLFGLPLVPKRKINFGPPNPPEAREIFIRSALVEGDFDTRAPFWHRNRELVEYVVDLENRSRRRDLLVDEQLIYEYYDKRIPEEIYSTPQFDKWLRKESHNQPKLLHMRLDDLMRQEAAEYSDEQFPDVMDVNGMQLPLEYHFDPGHKRDGVTMKIPKAVLNQVSEDHCEWLIPGLLHERVIALLRGLPKPIRKSFVPVPDYANACLKVIEPSDKSLTRALAEQLKKMTGIHIPEDAWESESLPGHLRMNFQVLDEKGKQVDAGRDLMALKKRHDGKGSESYHSLPDSGLEREGLTDWDFATLPETIEMNRGGIKLRGFPALIDEGNTVALRVLDSHLNAEKASRAGLRRLYVLKLAKDIRYLRRNLKGLERMLLQYTKAASPPEGFSVQGKLGLESELVALIVDLTFIEGQPEVRDESRFNARIGERRGELMALANEATVLLGDTLSQYQLVRKALSAATQINWMLSVSDMNQQLDRLVFQGFLQHTPYQQLKQLPRYLKALAMRIEKLQHAASRDQQLVREMQTLFQQWQARDERYREGGKMDKRVEEMRWQFEELRVSLFAQELGTAYPVSLKRIEKRWKVLGL
ncbi:ATP-dependent RNA helicase HrpA [Candidatus Vondammii sp. HM_W22]|uniref:ATP-dependent RNA helicase HrpA n=1 Tax=Candidatus Vondammii sp. HM_W22 TaxID=2687299 RepID=UPI001F12FE3B|nr:ATP-dependent RNA helicase HrpA [Candidatus Vondammii sp. HM_W22]